MIAEMRFSERQGFKKVSQILQTDSMDVGLRNRLWNVFMSSCMNAHDETFLWYHGKAQFRSFCLTLWHDHLKRPGDTIADTTSAAINQIRQHFFGCDWY